MNIRIPILDYTVEAHLRSRRSWRHFRIHKHSFYKHLIWGKLSITYGRPHLVPIRVCRDCYEEIQVISAGDECWDYCEGCNQVEGYTVEITTQEYEAIHS